MDASENSNKGVAIGSEVDQSLLSLATAVVQAQEKLHLAVKSRHHDKSDICHKLLPDSVKVLDSVREMRSKIDGSHFHLEPVISGPDVLSELKTLMLMHVPSSVNQQVQEKFQQLILKLFQGSSRRVLFASLVTCPWYCSTHTDRGQQAKHNRLFVVFAVNDSSFFCPCPADLKIRHEIVDEGWFYATEVSAFAQYLAKGKSRCVETLFTVSGAVLFEDKEWTALKQFIKQEQLLRLRGFLEQCRGQAVGTVAKKNKSGVMRLLDSATLYHFCESFKLLHHIENVVEGRELYLDDLHSCDLSSSGQQALQSLTEAYMGHDITKHDLLTLMLTWKDDLEKKMKGIQFTPQNEIYEAVGKWLVHIRTRGGQVIPTVPSPLCTDDLNLVQKLLSSIGGNIQEMAPQQILMIARAGSFLYDLHTETSDVDYVVIYAESTENVISAVKPLCEIRENRGPQKQIEYGAYEARMFCEMLWKASIVILELVFSEKLEYMSPAWQELISHRDLFVTENAILQYMGIIRNNMKDIQVCKFMDNPKREAKVFYQIFHKLDSLRYFLRGVPPVIKCSGEQREFIMKIRRGPLTGDFSREKLQCLAEQKFEQLLTDLAARDCRLREQTDMDFLTKWLIRVRGWPAAS